MRRKSLALGILLFFLSCPAFAAVKDIQTMIISGNWEAAAKECQAVLSANPAKEKQEMARFYLGLVNFKQQRFAESRSNFNIFLNDFPESGYANFARLGVADTYLLEGNDSLAGKIYLKLLDTQDKRVAPAVYSRLINLDLKLEDRAKAGEYLTALHAQYPQSFEAAQLKALPEEEVVLASENTAEEEAVNGGPEPDFFTVQVGAFAQEERADKLYMELKQKGEEAYIILPDPEAKPALYRVRVGKFTSSDDAEDLAEKLSAKGYPTKVFP